MQSIRHLSYIAAYAIATRGEPFTLQQLAEYFTGNRIPFYFGSNKTTDAGVFNEAFYRGDIQQINRAKLIQNKIFKLTPKAYQSGLTAAKSLNLTLHF